jgi:hypothetical protein
MLMTNVELIAALSYVDVLIAGVFATISLLAVTFLTAGAFTYWLFFKVVKGGSLLGWPEVAFLVTFIALCFLTAGYLLQKAA